MLIELRNEIANKNERKGKRIITKRAIRVKINNKQGEH